MHKIDSEASLREAILQLENKQADESVLLKEQFKETYERVKPISLIKDILRQVGESVDVKDNLLGTSVGLTAGYISKIIFQSLTKSPVKRLIGTALMFGITNVVAKNPDVIKSLGKKVLSVFRKRKHTEE